MSNVVSKVSLFVAVLLGPIGAEAQAPTQKLNVLVVLTDDQNDDLGTYGHPLVKTPHLDRLAAMGVRFDNAEAQYPLCNPSRASMLSGKRPDTTKVFNNTTRNRTSVGKARFLPEYFRDHGYFTINVGKSQHQPFLDEIDWNVLIRPGEDFGPYTETFYWGPDDNPEPETVDGVLTRKAAALLEEHKDKPIFMIVGLRKPHLPFMCPAKYHDLYPPASIKLPKELGEPANDRADIPGGTLPTPARPNWPSMSDAQKRQVIASYYACQTFTDANLGYLLDKLEALELLQTTIVVFVSDHGFHLDEHGGLFEKDSLFQESIRVPLVVAAPGKARGVVAPGFVELVDLYPTLAELAGLPPPPGMEGYSFAPLLDDPQRPWKKAVFSQMGAGRRVRAGHYRYTEWGSPGKAELYDLEKDPQEWKNLVGDPSHAKALADMRALLQGGWRQALPSGDAPRPTPAEAGPDAAVPDPASPAEEPKDAVAPDAPAIAGDRPHPAVNEPAAPAAPLDPARAASESGCGCRLGATPRVASGSLIGLALLLIVARRRRAPPH